MGGRADFVRMRKTVGLFSERVSAAYEMNSLEDTVLLNVSRSETGE